MKIGKYYLVYEDENFIAHDGIRKGKKSEKLNPRYFTTLEAGLKEIVNLMLGDRIAEKKINETKDVIPQVKAIKTEILTAWLRVVDRVNLRGFVPSNSSALAEEKARHIIMNT